MKKCTTCKAELDTSSFNKDNSRFDKLQASCRKCSKEAAVRFNINRPNYKKESSARWDKENPDKAAARCGKKDAVRRGAVVPDNYDNVAATIWYTLARMITKDTGIKHEVDHIVPCREGGLHCASNMQVLTKTDNHLKG
jgi:hypothetical protein